MHRRIFTTAAIAVGALACGSAAFAAANSVSTKPDPAFISHVDKSVVSKTEAERESAAVRADRTSSTTAASTATTIDDHGVDDPAAHDVVDDHGVDDPATHDVADDHGVDDPATHDVADDHGVDDPATHDLADDHGHDSVRTTSSANSGPVRTPSTVDDHGGRGNDGSRSSGSGRSGGSDDSTSSGSSHG